MNKIIDQQDAELITEFDDLIETELQVNPIMTEKPQKHPIIVIFVLMAVLLSANIFLALDTLNKGASAAVDAFNSEKDIVSSQVYQDFYQRSKDAAEAKHHVSNDITISIGSLKEESKLEVLRVNDVEYMIQEEKDGVPVLSWIQNVLSKDMTTWIEVPGNGVFTVNLRSSEFIIDNARKYVLIRIPNPELSEFSIDYENVKLLEFHEGKKHSVKDGEDTVREQLQNASLSIQQSISTNQRFYQSAKDSAQKLLTNLVKELNPDVEGLTIEVEFMD